ncbi:ABC transporter, permease protein [Umbribacter vaginalis]|jgi:hypothetical protein|nr:ABC transporter, permease protein [Coriobacteriales bacterium DNF00809]
MVLVDKREWMFMMRLKKCAFASCIVVLLASVLVGAVSVLCVQPAYALNTLSLTAKPNGDSGSQVYGGSETRLTWEGEAQAGENISSITLTLPAGTTCSLDNSKFTALTGEDFFKRTPVDAHFSLNDGKVNVTLPQPLRDAAHFRIELYGVVFPASGGDMTLSGAYTSAQGSQQLASMPTISVTKVSLVDSLSHTLEQQPWVQAWNSNKFLKLFFNPPLLVSSFPVVINGFLLALAIVLVAFPLAIPVGLILSLMRMSHARILRALASIYVNVVRGTPMFLQIYIAFFGLPLAGIQVPSFLLGVLVLGMNSGAYLCEIFRGGIQSISKGQFEAARSLGMNGAQTMVFVIIPQTLRRVLPTMTSEFILLYKDTSLLAAVGVMEVVMYAKTIVAATGSITPYIVAACFYLIITLPLAKLVGLLERALDPTHKASKRVHVTSEHTAPREDHAAEKHVSPDQLASM